MRITFLGAAGEVTGSSYLVETGRSRLLVDCGLFQGRGATVRRNRDLGMLRARAIDAAVLTHAHIDHSGRFPMLAARGFRAPIHATPATCDVARILLEDSARLQEADARRLARRRQRGGGQPVEPLYTRDDVAAVVARFEPLPYDEPRAIVPDVSIRLVDAGHILGSASVEMTIREAGRDRVLVFSGDIGQAGVPFLRDPTPPERADVVVMESTYGDRDHRSRDETVDEFRRVLTAAVAGRSRVLIPAFAIGRAQEVLYELARLVRAGAVHDVPVYLDSPMAIEALGLYARHHDLLDAEAAALARSGGIFQGLSRLTYCDSVEQSKALNEVDGLAVIVAGSGMCEGGRIVHHLKHGLWRPETQVVIAGYQAEGTLGRALVEGAREVRVLGERIAVKAHVHTLGGFSAHAGQTELLAWARGVAASKPRFFLTHGEPPAREALRRALAERHGVEVVCPEANQQVTID